MKIDRSTKVALWVIAGLLFLNLVHSFFPSRDALAVPENESIGRYQISSWAAHSGGFTNRHGYYVLDTVTGRVVDREAQVSGRGEYK